MIFPSTQLPELHKYSEAFDEFVRVLPLAPRHHARLAAALLSDPTAREALVDALAHHAGVGEGVTEEREIANLSATSGPSDHRAEESNNFIWRSQS